MHGMDANMGGVSYNCGHGFNFLLHAIRVDMVKTLIYIEILDTPLQST